MAKKRLIFTLLYGDGSFMLSRNFRLQRAGNIDWLLQNYDFSKIAGSIDELVILDVTRGQKNYIQFCEHIKLIARECFIPIATGGGITSLDHAKAMLNSGADKLVVNTALYRMPILVKKLIGMYGSQCIIGSVDVKYQNSCAEVYVENGAVKTGITLEDFLDDITRLGVGEIYLNSMDRDGTGHGYLFDYLKSLKSTLKIPLIIAGGAGNWHHLLEGLQHDLVDATATANLFNFIGQGFPNARNQLLNNAIDLAKWEMSDFSALKKSVILAR